MDAATLTAIVAVPATVVSVGSALWATVKQRRTEDASLVVQSFQILLENYRDENRDQRNRLKDAEAKIGDLRVQVAHCEADKTAMAQRYEAEIKALQAQLDSIQRQINDSTAS